MRVMTRSSIHGIWLLASVFALVFWAAAAFLTGEAAVQMRVVRERRSPSGDVAALVTEGWSLDPPDQTLWLAQSPNRAARSRLEHLGEDTDWCSAIAWSPDGSTAAS